MNHHENISCIQSTSASPSLDETFGDWQIRKDILYLDHGAFGACPKSVTQKQNDIRQWIEDSPHAFFERSYVEALESSKKALADFIHADPRDMTLLPGATHGLNVVIQSQRFTQNDEILTTNVAYSSVRMVLDHVAERDGARVVVVEVPLLVDSPEDVMQRILAGVTPRTRLAVIDHIPSRTGLVLPAKTIVRELDALGIDTLVDGAHAPGSIALDLDDIHAAYYVANCHKWMCAPRGSGFLHVRRDRAETIKPLVIARSPYVIGKSERSSLEHNFGWMGTYCPSAILSLPASIHHLKTVVPGGHGGLVRRNHELAVRARRIVCHAIGVAIPCPDTMIASMATIPLPESPEPEQEGMLPIQQALWKDHGIVIPVYSWPSYPKRVIRLSVQAYNHLDQYHKLANCLRMVLCNERKQIRPALNIVAEAETPFWTEEGQESHDSAYSSSTELSLVWRHGGQNVVRKGRQSFYPEKPYQDIENPTSRQLICLAQSRLKRIVTGNFASYPLSIFPTVGGSHVESLLDDKPKYQHVNLEASKMAYMLSRLPRRRIPQTMVSSVEQLLEVDDVIEKWHSWVGDFKEQAEMVHQAIVFAMKTSKTPIKFPDNAEEFVSRVIPYETERHDKNVSLALWRRALVDFTAGRQSCPERVTAFLQIHSFLKDPVGGLCGNFNSATDSFLSLFNSLRPEINFEKVVKQTWEETVVQLAFESSFLSQPLISEACYVHFEEDQQLVYSYADMFSLGRSEFACPEIVVRMMDEILGSDSTSECCVAPIAVTHCHSVCSSDGARAIIIDGNNRITTLTFLRFVAIYGLPQPERLEDDLRDHCRDTGLGPVSFVDFCAVAKMLQNSALATLKKIQSSACLSRFQDIRQVPVLITEEASFFTKLHVGNEEDIAQPVHQAIFATDELLVALPGKIQSHGRAKGFKAMPIR
ncbi:hypothetical protein FGRMN_10174 [Fusarium graminum]|nr:hypothetical protein FGRMN_10174 [Fusarium graminum]